MLPSISSAIHSLQSISPAQSSSQEDNPATKRVKLINEKLSTLQLEQHTYNERLTYCEEFFSKNNKAILTLCEMGDSIHGPLKTVLATINSITDNDRLGEDNSENYTQINQSIDEIDKLIQSSVSDKTSTGERISKEIGRVTTRVGKEVERSLDKTKDEFDRVMPRVEKEVERSLDKTKDELVRVKTRVEKEAERSFETAKNKVTHFLKKL
ncbi:hypothetical protein [Symbiopectobacterium purcellii]|uniref:Uncharacterized protein n=1 Tax=Symbiopectobacterium purcellii TaxID=2871826 RepID=A0ABX9AG20_9ENTR|nr:hypothetical protein [Symbiopectobacterium purcellii]QZN94047.1 hypothetical protein K6K13_11600 [Symbiopectobacterium purcellii]